MKRRFSRKQRQYGLRIARVLRGEVKRPLSSRIQDFYDTPEWRRMRLLILTRDNYTCQLCGASPSNDGIVLHVDHKEPLSQAWGRRLDPTNLWTTCKNCNLGKGSLTLYSLRKKAEVLPK